MKLDHVIFFLSGTQGAAWTKDKAHLEGLIAGVASDLKNIDDRANSAAIAAAAATDTANTAAVGASTAVAQAAALAREQAESQSAAAAAGIGVGSGPGCGCDSQNVVLPDNYQTISEDVSEKCTGMIRIMITRR